MPKVLPEITYTKEDNIPVIDSENSQYKLLGYKNQEYFDNYESYVRFIKETERLVRTNERYKNFINHLKTEARMDRCQVLKDVNDEDASIELHHGPIFTLFMDCAIVLEYFLLKDWKVSTFRIADAVLTEHEKHRIQCMMVSTTVHELIHQGKIFIHYKQSFGDVVGFIKKYRNAISKEYREKINQYIEKSLLMDSTDYSVLELNDVLFQ